MLWCEELETSRAQDEILINQSEIKQILEASPKVKFTLEASVHLECERLKAVAELATFFAQQVAPLLACDRRGASKHFETWLHSRKSALAGLSERADPVLPSGPLACEDPELVRKITQNGIAEGRARAACHALGQAASRIVARLFEMCLEFSRAPEEKNRVTLRAAADPTQVLVCCGATELPVNRAHLSKLHALYRRRPLRILDHSPNLRPNLVTRGVVEAIRSPRNPTYLNNPNHSFSDEEAATEAGEHETVHNPDSKGARWLRAAFCCLARYHALQGGDAKGGRMQAALPAPVFELLRHELGVSLELFASPLNCRYDRFCSAFADCDHAFGSLGSVFDFRPAEGVYEANPPFEPSLVT
jgi:hypothetical protein